MAKHRKQLKKDLLEVNAIKDYNKGNIGPPWTAIKCSFMFYKTHLILNVCVSNRTILPTKKFSLSYQK